MGECTMGTQAHWGPSSTGIGRQTTEVEKKGMYTQMQNIVTEDLEDPIGEEQVDMALHVFKTATAVGIDLLSPGDLRKLPKAALRELAALL
eukprot:11066933-Karenia_brevis.AAC.1